MPSRAPGPAAAILVAVSQPALAQESPASTPNPTVVSTGRAGENVVRQAEDAFGTTIGRESIGIYTAGNVRGFSALAAGNARINGLYFDQVAAPSSRVRRSIAIKVGLSALSYPFPAPTGVVDYGLIRPEGEPSASATLSADSYRNASIDLDAVLPIGDRLSVGGGAGVYRNDFVNGATSVQTIAGLSALFRPIPEVEVQPFWSRVDTYDNRIGPLYVPANPELPPPAPRRRFFGQDWTQFDGASLLYGGIAKARLGQGWTVDLGLFRSAFLTKRDTFVGLEDILSDGTGRYLVFTDPPGKTASTSGELRMTRTFVEGQRAHRVVASLRGRNRRQLFGGSDERDFGLVRIGEKVEFEEPDYIFGEQSLDRVRQLTGGLAYTGRWTGVGEINLGLSKSDYRKRVARPGVAIAETRSRPFLYYGTVALDIADRLTAYAGYTRGLEESGVAPQSATNRNEALPAILTSQRDAGVRWAITEKLRLIAGVFDIRKPYFSLDPSGLFTQLGVIRSRGLELSLSGAMTDRLRIVAGGVLLDPDVTGEGVGLGRVGPRPVGLPKRKLDLSADWRTPIAGVSFDLRVTNQSRRPATTLNTVYLPRRTLIDLGGRYQFKIGGRSATLRVSASNIFDVRGYDLFGAGTYDIIDGRVINAYVAADF